MTEREVKSAGQLGAIPTATGGISRLANALARAAGVETKPLLRQAALSYRDIEDRHARIGVRHQIQFLNLIADAVHDEFLGFHLGQEPDLRELGLLYYVAASSDTLGDALQRAARYSSIVNEGLQLVYLQEADRCKIAFNYVGVTRHLDRHQIEFSITALVRLCRQLTHTNLMPRRVRLAHHRTKANSELAAFFGVTVEFSAGVDEVAFPGLAKSLAVVGADPYLNELLIENCEEALSRRRSNRSLLRAAVENAIVPLLPHGCAHAGEIAKRLGLSQRTLARRLASETLTFSDVLQELRSDLAKQYLADRELSISRIAWLLGYQEVSAFTHAFNRWTGRTPRQARVDRIPKLYNSEADQ